MANLIVNPAPGLEHEIQSEQNELELRRRAAMAACGLNDRVFRDFANTQLLDRESPRGMDIDEFVAILRKYLHPRWVSVRVLRTRYGARVRGELGLAEMGTVQTCTWDKPWEDHNTVPCPYLPYFPTVNWEWDEKLNKWAWDRPKPIPGWRSILEDLVKVGVLRNHRRLTYLIGKDTASLAGKWRI